MRTAKIGWDMTYSGPMSFAIVYFLQEEAARRNRIQLRWDLRRAQRYSLQLAGLTSHASCAMTVARL